MKKLEYKKSGTSNKKRSAHKKVSKIEKNDKSLKKGASTHSNNSKTESNKSKKRKVFVISIIFIFSVLLLSCYLILTLPTFNVEDFQIEGTDKYSIDEIVEKTGLKRGENIFVQLLKGVSKSINDLPYVQKANIKIIWPNKLDIKITERVCSYFAFDKDKNKFYKIDKDGYILEEGNITEKLENEILVYGFIFDDEVVFGSQLKDVDLSKINIFCNISNEFAKSGINGSITKVNFENSLTTITLNDKLNVIFPNDTDIKYKMTFFKSILAKIGEDSVGVIDMTKTDPVFSSF